MMSKRLSSLYVKGSGCDDVFIFIDQEEGRVQRMSRLHVFDLIKGGFNANYLPVLDIPIRGARDMIGTRMLRRRK
ncbi:hypothetical protein [Bartonella taylorii]|uniref:hypothetical protein n=1 Tax=Bartonella taylorii TaxID=33046 RepID=UPI001FED8D72|nr:hypothetical protein [Bartonella taylorii]